MPVLRCRFPAKNRTCAQSIVDLRHKALSLGRSESRGTAWRTSRIVSALPDVPVHGAENVQDAYCAFRHAGARRRKRFLGGDDLWGGSGILGDLLSVQRKVNGSDILLTDR